MSSKTEFLVCKLFVPKVKKQQKVENLSADRSYKTITRKPENQNKKITQCTAMQTAIAFALTRPGNISDRSRLGTGPAPRENVKTNLFHVSNNRY